VKAVKKISIIIITGILISSFYFAFSQQAGIDAAKLYKQVELFADAISLINLNYIDVIKPRELMYGALRGMLASLDDYSSFLDPDSYKELRIDTEGRFGGLGIEISMKGGILTIISPIDGTPAAKAGLRPGDVIVKIDGEPTKDIQLHETVKKLRGKPGTSVTLSIWRQEKEVLFDVEITREIIEIKSIKEARILDGGVGYIKIVEFQEMTAKDMEKALKEILSKNSKGLILDLRNNPGGLLDSAVDVSEIFLPKGELIVSTKGRNPKDDKEYRSSRNTPYQKMDLIVLVNEGSASASEIIAGAVKDNKRGLIVGEKTFGKGSVQTVIPLKDKSAIRITTAKYFTPGNYSITDIGIMPDISVPLEEKEAKEGEEVKTEELDNQLKAALEAITIKS